MNAPMVGRPDPVVVAGVVLGVGLGGFVDGILLHQLLQWHHMLSGPLPAVDLVSVKVNMFWDGLFHALTWMATVLGVGLLWRASHRRDAARAGRVLVGASLMGWGLFNFVEGLVDHQLLGVHHVKPGPRQLAWDLGFLAAGLILIGLGWTLSRRTNTARLGSPPRAAPAPAAA